MGRGGEGGEGGRGGREGGRGGREGELESTCIILVNWSWKSWEGIHAHDQTRADCKQGRRNHHGRYSLDRSNKISLGRSSLDLHSPS